MKIKYISVLFLVLLISGTVCGANNRGLPTTHKGINYQELTSQQRQEFASEWGLTPSDLLKYQQIMEGKRGLWSPGLDPITALGVEAETAEERARLAQIFVEQEAKRVQKEVEFQRAVDEAWAKLYPNTPRISNKQTRKVDIRESIVRLGFASTLTCSSECKEILESLIGYISDPDSDLKLDIFIVGAGNEKELRDWVEQQGLSIELIKEERLTINHAEGFDPNGEYPKQYIKKAGSSWQEI